jgi:hypothetical protein
MVLPNTLLLQSLKKSFSKAFFACARRLVFFLDPRLECLSLRVRHGTVQFGDP